MTRIPAARWEIPYAEPTLLDEPESFDEPEQRTNFAISAPPIGTVITINQRGERFQFRVAGYTSTARQPLRPIVEGWELDGSKGRARAWRSFYLDAVLGT